VLVNSRKLTAFETLLVFKAAVVFQPLKGAKRLQSSPDTGGKELVGSKRDRKS
jgi:hypothetical protein